MKHYLEFSGRGNDKYLPLSYKLINYADGSDHSEDWTWLQNFKPNSYWVKNDIVRLLKIFTKERNLVAFTNCVKLPNGDYEFTCSTEPPYTVWNQFEIRNTKHRFHVREVSGNKLIGTLCSDDEFSIQASGELIGGRSPMKVIKEEGNNIILECFDIIFEFNSNSGVWSIALSEDELKLGFYSATSNSASYFHSTSHGGFGLFFGANDFCFIGPSIMAIYIRRDTSTHIIFTNASYEIFDGTITNIGKVETPSYNSGQLDESFATEEPKVFTPVATRFAEITSYSDDFYSSYLKTNFGVAHGYWKPKQGSIHGLLPCRDNRAVCFYSANYPLITVPLMALQVGRDEWQ